MILGGAVGEVNPNSSWLSSRGVWLAYGIAVMLLHFILLSFPFLTVAAVWTLTNVTHNMVMFYVLHIMKGTPWEMIDQGKARTLTHWEQIDSGEQFTSTRKFLTVVPIVLFCMVSFYTKFDATYAIINLITLVVTVYPKLQWAMSSWN